MLKKNEKDLYLSILVGLYNFALMFFVNFAFEKHLKVFF